MNPIDDDTPRPAPLLEEDEGDTVEHFLETLSPKRPPPPLVDRGGWRTTKMRIGSLFSGVGGFELGLERAGLGETVWQVETNPYCLRVLARHWPHAKRLEDIKNAGSDSLDPVDLICGGFPCQDISAAGKGAGLVGERSGLWGEFARVVNEMLPEWVVVENVASGAGRWVDTVVQDLGKLGYESLPLPVEASDLGAPHRRARVFVIAHRLAYTDRSVSVRGTNEPWGQSQERATAVRDGGKLAWPPGPHDTAGWQRWLEAGGPSPGVVRPVRGSPDGVSYRLARHTRSHALSAMGNAVVPACAETVGHVIRLLAESDQGC